MSKGQSCRNKWQIFSYSLREIVFNKFKFNNLLWKQYFALKEKFFLLHAISYGNQQKSHNQFFVVVVVLTHSGDKGKSNYIWL